MKKDQHVAEMIIEIFKERNIQPDRTFTATAGQDWGFVAAWELPGRSKYVLHYGNNGETNYDFSDDIDDLSEWLLHDGLNGIDRVLERALVLGIDEIDEATESDDSPYYILVSRDYYGPTSKTSIVFDPLTNNEYLEFDTIAEAQEWIDNEEDGPYCCAHNEIGRPDYKIVVA